MKRISFNFILLILESSLLGQINMSDSTFQVIGYWAQHEKQSYTVTEEKYKVSDSDTTSRENSRYDVEVTIIDSTASSYTIDWFYKNYTIDSDNEIYKKLASIAEDMHIRIMTDEFGAFKEVINWKDVKSYMHKAIAMLKKEFKEIPNMDKILIQVEALYSSKEAIEAGAIKEIQQFYSFHGGKYKLGEQINARIKLPNLYGGEPFDADIVLWLDEMNADDNNSILRMNQVVDSVQLTNAAYAYIAKMSDALGTELPKREDFPPLRNNIWTASRIHGSGWIIYSVETKEVSADNILNFEERIIEIQ